MQSGFCCFMLFPYISSFQMLSFLFVFIDSGSSATVKAVAARPGVAPLYKFDGKSVEAMGQRYLSGISRRNWA